jgi:hypothetical protein
MEYLVDATLEYLVDATLELKVVTKRKFPVFVGNRMLPVEPIAYFIIQGVF